MGKVCGSRDKPRNILLKPPAVTENPDIFTDGTKNNTEYIINQEET